ncbi:hypothetical protein WJX77_001443 [Trebouxia sp. C0004]
MQRKSRRHVMHATTVSGSFAIWACNWWQSNHYPWVGSTGMVLSRKKRPGRVSPSAEPRKTVEAQPKAAAPPKAVWTGTAINNSLCEPGGESMGKSGFIGALMHGVSGDPAVSTSPRSNKIISPHLEHPAALQPPIA